MSRRLPAILRRPDVGWSSLLLLIGLLLLLGLSVADSRPLPLQAGGPSASGMLPWVMLLAGLLGFLLARSPLGVVRAHLVGAGVAALVLLLMAGAAELQAASALPLSLDETSLRITAVWERMDRDVSAYLDDPRAAPTMATYLLLGAICWTTAQFSAFAVFRYERAGPAVIAIGAVLLINLGLGPLDPETAMLPVVAVLGTYSLLSLLLLMRLQLSHQRQQWARRHISDGGEVGRLFLRSGAAFVVVVVLAATSLTTWATVERPDVDLGELHGPLADIGDELTRWLGIVGARAPVGPATTIDDSWAVGDRWEQPSGTAFRALVDGQLRGNYWWGTAHDHFDGRSWDREELETIDVAAGEPVPVWELASAGGEHLLSTTITIEGQGPAQGSVFRPAEAGILSRDVQALIVDEGNGIGDMLYRGPLEVGESVVIDSWVRDYSRDGDSLTARDLQEADEDYPDWTDRYLQGADEATSGARIGREARRIEGRFDNAYDRALESQRLLRDMTYTTDMRGICGPDEPIPECVLRTQQGFCQHYATTMAMLLRAMGIPSRVVTGYLPGERIDEEWVVEQAAYHNWVEAYFPGYGWVRFEPTPRDEYSLTPTRLPAGPSATDDPGDPRPTEPPFELPTFEPDQTPEPLGAGTIDEGPPAGPLLPLLAGGLLLLTMVALASALLLVRLRRLSEADGGLAYRGVVSMATRLGHGPHPAQTEYEYAGSLSKAVPGVRDEIYVVVGARVESAYGRRSVTGEQQGALRRAYARIRTALLRLWFRRRS